MASFPISCLSLQTSKSMESVATEVHTLVIVLNNPQPIAAIHSSIPATVHVLFDMTQCSLARASVKAVRCSVAEMKDGPCGRTSIISSLFSTNPQWGGSWTRAIPAIVDIINVADRRLSCFYLAVLGRQLWTSNTACRTCSSLAIRWRHDERHQLGVGDVLRDDDAKKSPMLQRMEQPLTLYRAASCHISKLMVLAPSV